MIATTSNPQMYSGAAQQMLFRRYGNPLDADFMGAFIIHWDIQDEFPWFPAESINVHIGFKTRLAAAFKELEQKGLHTEIKTFDGCYGQRLVAGSSEAMSVHAWGAAIDMNAEENQVGTAGTWSCSFLEVMLLNGIFCGQNWVGRKDPMHFAMVNG